MYKKYLKRLFDILLSLVGMPLLLIILVIFAPIIYFSDRGPIFYNAQRLGRSGKVFTMLKLRSMYVNAPDIRLNDGSTYNAADDSRVTPIGRFLRKTSFDETPQIINVLLGDMSIIGPRPDLPDSLGLYGSNQIVRNGVRPGITGYCQAYFRNEIDLNERFKHDAKYVHDLSFRLDVRIFVKTIIMVLMRKGIYRKPNTEERVINDS